jgi:DNA-binding transcriptional regulator YiaG
MIHYPHFAFNNLYLNNGYEEHQTEYGLAYSYKDENGLEQLIRIMLLRKIGSLSGWELRFLRRGLKLSQTEFAMYLSRDAQTIARIEKSNKLISQSEDLMIRTLFAKEFEPSLTVAEILSLITASKKSNKDKIYLNYENKWSVVDMSINVLKEYNDLFTTSIAIENEKAYYYLKSSLEQFHGNYYTELRSIADEGVIMVKHSKYIYGEEIVGDYTAVSTDLTIQKPTKQRISNEQNTIH